MIKLRNKKGEGYHGALILGFVLLLLFGGLLPLILKDFAPSLTNYEGFLSPIQKIIKFYTWGNFETFLLNQLQGFSIIPSVIAIPLMLIVFGLITYGTIKLLPETEIGTAIAGIVGIGASIAGIIGAIFGG